MLCQFSFQNFKSYKDETTFDFRAMAIPEFQDALIRREKAEDLLPVSAVYGPNGGGKTNLLQAFFCLINLVVKPIHALEKNRQPMIFQQGSSVAPFMLDESSANEPTIFQVFFRVGEKEYQYYISYLTIVSAYRQSVIEVIEARSLVIGEPYPSIAVKQQAMRRSLHSQRVFYKGFVKIERSS